MFFCYKNDVRAITPNKNHFTDSGFDLFALEDVVVRPGEVVTVKTGICLGFQENMAGVIFDKSSRGKSGLKVLGGVIDGYYVGEINIVVGNLNILPVIGLLGVVLEEKIKENTINVRYGQALAQLILFNRVLASTIAEVEESKFREMFSSRYASTRGERGFGSSKNSLGDQEHEISET